MKQGLKYRKIIIDDLGSIVKLLAQDELGKDRDEHNKNLDQRYIDAFHMIDEDQNQYLMVVENDFEIVGTCHLTLIPSLTFRGSTRMQIEAVRVSEKYHGQKIGQWMIKSAIEYGKSRGASIIQLTTNKARVSAKRFYESLGFEDTHSGMKLYI